MCVLLVYITNNLIQNEPEGKKAQSPRRHPVGTKKIKDAVGEELTGFGESGRYLNRTVLKK